MQPPRLILTLLAALLLAAPAAGQTVKTLAYATNGQVIAATNLVWTNSFSFSTNSVAAQVRTNLGLGWSALTNTNSANFRSAIGLGASDNVYFNTTGGTFVVGGTSRTEGSFSASFGNDNGTISFYPENYGVSIDIQRSSNVAAEQNILQTVTIGTIGEGDAIALSVPVTWNVGAAATRTNLGLGLPALTNDSNVTMMRALSGSTNTNHPFSGTVSVVGTNNTNTLVFSNGILSEVQ